MLSGSFIVHQPKDDFATTHKELLGNRFKVSAPIKNQKQVEGQVTFLASCPSALMKVDQSFLVGKIQRLTSIEIGVA